MIFARFYSWAQDFQDQAIKITKSTQRLVSSGHFAGEQATQQAYEILGSAADYINDLDQYEVLLNRTAAFFESLRSVSFKKICLVLKDKVCAGNYEEQMCNVERMVESTFNSTYYPYKLIL